MPGTVAITGAYGYLGGLLRRRLEAAGWSTTALVRRPRPGDRAVAWALGESPPDGVLDEADALVHCAWDFTPRTREGIWHVNVEGSIQLLEAAERAGVQRTVALSSMSAFVGTKQLYGRAKLAVEERCVELGGISVRPGLVYGSEPEGMAGALMKLTRLPVVPVMGGRAHQFPVHEDDLADAILMVLEAPSWRPEVFGIAQPIPLGFRELLAALAALQGGRCRFLPVPWQAVFAALRVAEALRAPVPLRSDSVYGLVRPATAVPLSTAFPDLLDQLRVLGRSA